MRTTLTAIMITTKAMMKDFEFNLNGIAASGIDRYAVARENGEMI
jgi:hypothetical protein